MHSLKTKQRLHIDLTSVITITIQYKSLHIKSFQVSAVAISPLALR